MIGLKYGDYEADILPDVGGSVARLAFAGVRVLRPVPPGIDDANQSGCYPLVPYANRIAYGRMRFGDHSLQLPLTLPGDPHSLHGHGWRTKWRTVSQKADALVLAYDYKAESWPWNYSAEESFSLSDEGFSVRLAATNRSEEPMPLSLGLHPWFVRTLQTVLTASVEGVWLADDTLIPTERVEGSRFLDLKHGAKLSDAPFVDYCHTDWNGLAVLDQPDLGRRVTLTATPECRFMHVYTPIGANFVCVEPVSAMPNAFNRPEESAVTGARTLAPGESFAIAMKIHVEKL